MCSRRRLQHAKLDAMWSRRCRRVHPQDPCRSCCDLSRTPLIVSGHVSPSCPLAHAGWCDEVIGWGASCDLEHSVHDRETCGSQTNL